MNRPSAEEVRHCLRSKANESKAAVLQRFFKTGKGEYAEGDIFLGISVPELRKTARDFQSLSFAEITKLLHSQIHEERMTALLVLVFQFSVADEKQRERIYSLYIRSSKWINNWDLVDLSAPQILGSYLLHKDKKILRTLATSKNMWERRIAIVSTYAFIRQNSFVETLKISEILRDDSHDLIHKAVGWMLREVGKRDLEAEKKFLGKYYKRLPRTMLRYAIEKFPESERKNYLRGEI